MRFALLPASFLSIATTIFAQQKDIEQSGSAVGVSFTNQIAPILTRKCLTCHGPEKSKGGFRLDTFELLLKPGESKSASIVSGKPQPSELYRRVTIKDEDDRMPQKADPLPEAEIVLIERWIKEGARFDGPDAKAPLVSLVPRTPHPNPPANYARPVPVTALAFSLDGQELAVGGYHEITIWNPADGKLLRRITGVAQRTQSLAYSPAGGLAAAGGSPGESGEVALFDPVKGTLLKVLGTMSDMMLDVKFSPDGTRLAVCGADNAIHVYDVATGKEQLRIEQHADWVMAVDFSRDGTQLGSASRDKTARIFDSKTGELETTYVGHTAAVFDVAFNNDGKTVCSVGRDKKIHFWDTKEAKAKGEIGGFDDEVFKIVVAGNHLFTCSADRKVRQHSIEKRELVRTFSGHRDWVYSIAFDPASQHLASGGYDGEVRVWNIQDGQLVAAFTAAPGYLAAGKKN
ncbi:MAG: c-type cytochrome domain-containing protein [Verrucomicrobiota bacterium]